MAGSKRPMPKGDQMAHKWTDGEKEYVTFCKAKIDAGEMRWEDVVKSLQIENTQDAVLRWDGDPELNYETVRGMWRRMNKPAKVAPESKRGNPKTEDLTEAELDEYIETHITQQAILQKADGYDFSPDVPVDETGWFCIAYGSDWHIGNTWTQTRLIIDEAEIIAKTPHMYFAFGGDDIDGGIPGAPHAGIINEQAMPVQMQRLVSALIAGKLASKMLLACGGCHNRWTHDIADYDFARQAWKISECRYLGGGGKYYLNCSGGASYCGAYHHKAVGYSQYNDLHPCVKRALYHEQEADIITIAHHHIIAVGQQMIGERMRYMARTSTRKHFDRYASTLAADGKRYPGMDVPVLLLHGTEKKAQWIMGIELAAQILGSLNGGSDAAPKLKEIRKWLIESL